MLFGTVNGFEVKMGICMSTDSEESQQLKRSQAIDRKLQEDSRRLRRECKILLLGMALSLDPCLFWLSIAGILGVHWRWWFC